MILNPFVARTFWGLLAKTLVMLATAIAVGTIAGRMIRHIETCQEPVISTTTTPTTTKTQAATTTEDGTTTTTTTLPEIYFDSSINFHSELMLEVTASPSENLIFWISGVGDAITISLKTGKVTINEKLSLDEASKHFWETIFGAFPDVRKSVCSHTNDSWQERYFSKKEKVTNMGACICSSDL